MMQNWAFGAFGKSRSKSKTPDEHHAQCQPFVNNIPQTFTCQPQPNVQLQTHIYQPEHSVYTQHNGQHMQIPMATCHHQWQSHMIQSPTLQPVVFPIHDQLPNNTSIEQQSNGQQQPQQNMVMSNQIQHEMPPTVPPTNHQLLIPTYQQNGTQVPQMATMSAQSSRFSDNSYYSNQVPAIMQQQHNHHHEQQLENRMLSDEQHYTTQHNPQQQVPNGQPNYLTQQTKSQQVPNRQNQQQHQQHYQNNTAVIRHDTNGESDLSLRTLCLIFESDSEELMKMANGLKDDLSKLAQELEVIRKKTPKYSVTKFKI